MKQIKCKNCGSNVDPNSTICDYCGGYFEKKTTSDTTKQVNSSVQLKTSNMKLAKITDDVLNSMVIGNASNASNASNAGTAAMIAFMIVWCGAAFFMAIMVPSSGAPIFVALVPFGMGVFGAIAMSGSIKASIASNPKDVNILCEQKKYNEAYSLLQQKFRATNNNFVKSPILAKLIIIGYYRIGDIDQVKEYISILETIDYDKNPVIIKIAKELNVGYEVQEPEKFGEDDF